jgi:hypothetical protein
MGFFKKLFGQESDAPQESGIKHFREKDNMGTRHDTLSKASSYWFARISQVKKDPFVIYTFDNGEDAQKALLELPCIHIAEDSHNLICTQVLIFGYYPTEEGKYEAVICGDDLTPELWQKAVESFNKYGGKRKNDLEPEKRKAPAVKENKAAPAKVKFIREDRVQKYGETMIYRVHNAPDAASAKAFLEKNPVTRKYYYVVVETPEGNYCRDIDGICKE